MILYAHFNKTSKLLIKQTENSIYIGECSNCLQHGIGQTLVNKQYYCIGGYQNGFTQGFCRITNANGRYYEGEYCTGQFHGLGTLQIGDKTWFGLFERGQFVEGIYKHVKFGKIITQTGIFKKKHLQYGEYRVQTKNGYYAVFSKEFNENGIMPQQFRLDYNGEATIYCYQHDSALDIQDFVAVITESEQEHQLRIRDSLFKQDAETRRKYAQAHISMVILKLYDAAFQTFSAVNPSSQTLVEDDLRDSQGQIANKSEEKSLKSENNQSNAPKMSFYFGESTNLIPHGRGKMILPGVIYDGEFRDGQFYAGRCATEFGVQQLGVTYGGRRFEVRNEVEGSIMQCDLGKSLCFKVLKVEQPGSSRQIYVKQNRLLFRGALNTETRKLTGPGVLVAGNVTVQLQLFENQLQPFVEAHGPGNFLYQQYFGENGLIQYKLLTNNNIAIIYVEKQQKWFLVKEKGVELIVTKQEFYKVNQGIVFKYPLPDKFVHNFQSITSLLTDQPILNFVTLDKAVVGIDKRNQRKIYGGL